MKIALVWMLSCLVGVAHGQTVWRCGPDGRSYSDTPCPEGATVAVAVARPRADVDVAHEVARREQALAVQLMRERRQRQAQHAAGTGPAGIRGSRLAPPVPAAPGARQTSRTQRKQLLEEPGIWRATAPSSRRAKD